MKRVLLMAGLFAATVAGAEPAHSVAWYRQNEPARTAQLRACNDDPGRLEKTPDCINARHAAAEIEAAKRGNLNLAPLSGDEIMRRIDARRRAYGGQ